MELLRALKQVNKFSDIITLKQFLVNDYSILKLKNTTPKF